MVLYFCNDEIHKGGAIFHTQTKEYFPCKAKFIRVKFSLMLFFLFFSFLCVCSMRVWGCVGDSIAVSFFGCITLDSSEIRKCGGFLCGLIQFRKRSKRDLRVYCFQDFITNKVVFTPLLQSCVIFFHIKLIYIIYVQVDTRKLSIREAFCDSKNGIPVHQVVSNLRF